MNSQRREKLKIVFDIGVGRDTGDVQVGAVTLGHYVQVNGINDAQALRLIIELMRKHDFVLEFRENGQGVPIAAETYHKRVEKHGKWRVPIEAGGLKFCFGQVFAFNQAFILIEEVIAGAAITWEGWVSPFLIEDGFVQAWVTDVEYDYWQNAKDPLEYEVANRSYNHLPLKSNGLPPPLEQLEIDTSMNPGRWLHKSGYIEAIGSTMWLGELFWRHIGESRRKILLSNSWLEVQCLVNGVIRVVSCPQCFFDETTEKMQNTLRSILYSSE